jgi:hypothetical protein
MQSLLFLQYLKWHYFDASRDILKAWGNFLWFNLNYFSVLLLLKTFFAPWRRITWEYGRGFDIGRYLFIFGSNLISRILGAIMRSFLIGVGIFTEVVLLFLGMALLIIWLVLPVLIAASFFYGILLLF